MEDQKQAVLELVETHRGQGRIGRRGVGQCGSSAIELLPVEEERGEKKRTSDTIRMSSRSKNARLSKRSKKQHPAVPPSAYPGDVAAAGSVSISIGDLRAFEGSKGRSSRMSGGRRRGRVRAMKSGREI